MAAFTKDVSGQKPKVSRMQDADALIARIIKSGVLERSGEKAIKEAHEAGRSATVLEGDVIYRLQPDGSKEFVKKIDQHKAA